MNKLVAVCIGVSKAGQLITLPGALSGAKKFENWARKNGYETHLLTDEVHSISASQIAGLIKSVIENGPDRLIIYFAGHGVQPTHNSMYWLLSDWENDSNEAINCSLSFSNAKRSGVSQIAVFADACRNTVQDVQSIGGQSIFPKKTYSHDNPQWDQFFATRMGQAAQEVGKEHLAYGIFSECVMAALDIKSPEAAVERKAGKTIAVTSQSLAKFLKKQVPLLSGQIQGAIVQMPDLTAGWLDPDDVYVERQIADNPNDPKKFATKKARMRKCGFDKGKGSGRTRKSAAKKATKKAADKTTKKEQNARMAVRAARRKDVLRTSRLSYLTRIALQSQSQTEKVANLKVKGSEVLQVVSASPKITVEHTKNGAEITVGARWTKRRAYQLIIQMKDRSWVPVVVLPDFTATVLVKGDFVASIGYMPKNAGQWDRSQEQQRRAIGRWNALSYSGQSPSIGELSKFGDQARQLKHQNPTLGILAAYAYERAGALSELASLSWYFASRDQMIPFDIYYLASLPSTWYSHRVVVKTNYRNREIRGEVAGRLPFMTQGWAFLDPSDSHLNSALFEIKKGLLPSLWTTLREREGTLLAELVRKGSV